MPDYNNGKIYTIRSHQTVGFYIGSTTQSLAVRFGGHKKDYKKYFKNNNKSYCSSYEILKFDDCYIELLENFSCESKDELLKREGEMIRLNIDVVVNKRIAGRTDKEWRIDNKEKIKEYYETNKEQLKQYRLENKESQKQYQKQYRLENKESQKQYQKQYYQNKKSLNNTTTPATTPTTI